VGCAKKALGRFKTAGGTIFAPHVWTILFAENVGSQKSVFARLSVCARSRIIRNITKFKPYVCFQFKSLSIYIYTYAIITWNSHILLDGKYGGKIDTYDDHGMQYGLVIPHI